MFEFAPQRFGITLENRFSRPRPFSKEQLDRIALWLTDRASGFAVQPAQVRARHTDVAFDYELSATFLSGNAIFKCTSEAVVLTVAGGRTQPDVELLQETITRFLNAVVNPEQPSVQFSANASAKAKSEAVRDAPFASFRIHDQIVMPCALGYVRVPGWSEAIRTAIEPHLGTPDSILCMWNTEFDVKEWPELSHNLVPALMQAIAIYGIHFSALAHA